MIPNGITVPVEVEFGDLEKLAAIFALTVEAEAIRAEVLGMRFHNEFDAERGHYDNGDFINAASELRSIAEKLRGITDKKVRENEPDKTADGARDGGIAPRMR